MEREDNDLLNRVLSIDSMIALLRRKPEDVAIYSAEGTRYLVLDYSSFGIHENQLLAVCEDIGCQVEIWIHPPSNFVVKGTVKSNDLAMQIDQIFTCFNEPVVVEPPPWLNATPDVDGSLRITDTRIPYVPHYD